MGFENKYPYTDFHEMNLDWILEVVKGIETEWPEFRTEMQNAWQQYQDNLTGEGGEWPTFRDEMTQDFDDFIHLFIDEFDNMHAYTVGDYVVNDGQVYKCEALPSPSHATPIEFDEYTWLRISNGVINQFSHEIMAIESSVKTFVERMVPEYSDQEYYNKDMIVRKASTFAPTFPYDFYIAKQLITPETWTPSHWERVNSFAQAINDVCAINKQEMQDQYDTFLASYQRQFGVVQTRGSSTTDVMSQKAVSDELDTIDNALNTIDNSLETIDNTLDDIENGDEIVGKANLANNFDSKMVLTDNSGYLYRTTGGSREVGEQNRVKKIIGASVPIVQVATNPDFASSGIGWSPYYYGGTTSWANGIITVTRSQGTCDISQSLTQAIPAGHKFLFIAKLKTASSNVVAFGGDNFTGSYLSSTTSFSVYSKIYTSTGDTARVYVACVGTESTEMNVDFVNVIDLTATFGTTVANRLYALEQAQAGTGVAKAKEILVKDYYPYNVTAFTHTKTSGKVNDGFNQWDEQWELGSLDVTTGLPTTASTRIRAKNKIRVIPNTTYYGKIPNGSMYALEYDDNDNYLGTYLNATNRTFVVSPQTTYIWFYCDNTYGATYKNDICINLHWDGERDGEYEPYQEWNYPVQDIELKGILSLDAQDNWVADGDEYLPSGVVDENIVDTDLADLNWQYYEQSGLDGIFYATVNDKDISNIYSAILGSKLNDVGIMAFGDFASSSVADNSFSMQTSSKYINVKYLTAGSDVNAFKTYITGLKLLYKSNNSTSTTATPYTELQNDSNWGTEKWIDTRDVPMPVFSTCEYIPDLKAKVETAPESPDEDGDYIMHRENGLNSYGSLSTWLSENGYNKMQDLLTTFGAGGMVGGTLRQQLATKESIAFNDTNCVNMKDLSWAKGSSGSDTVYYAIINDIAPEGTAGYGTKILCTAYPTAYTGTDFVNKSISGVAVFSTKNVCVKDNSFATIEEFIQSVQGQLIAYKKA